MTKVKNYAPGAEKEEEGTKEVVVKKGSELTNEVHEAGDFDMSDFMDDGLEMDDIRLESLVVTQSNSKARDENEALQEGDVYLSISRDIVAKKGEKIFFVPLYIKKLVQIFENETKSADPNVARKGKYIETVPSKTVPKSVPYIDEGYIRQQVRTVFGCILSEGFSKVVPYKISFKSSSMKSLNPVMLKVTEHVNAKKGNLPYDLVFSVATKKVSNDKNSWYILDTEYARLITDDEKEDIKGCVSLIKSLNSEVLLDDSDTETVE